MFLSKGGELSDTGLGYHSFNLNGFINATVIDQWWFGSKTKIFVGLPQIFGQYEGFSYLGAGILVACVACSLIIIFKKIIFKKRSDIHININELISILFLSLCSIFLALSPTISIGEHILVVIPWPKEVVNLLSIFRASGRFIWPVYYLIIIYLLYIIYLIVDKKVYVYIILLICLGIQIYDFSDILLAINRHYRQDFMYSSALKASCWQEELTTYDHVCLLGNQIYDNNIGVWTVKNGLTINDFYMARKNETNIQKWKDLQLENIQNNKDCDTTIFIFPYEQRFLIQKSYLNYYLVDGYLIGIKGTLRQGGFTIIQDGGESVHLGENQFLANGKDMENNRVIYYGGASFGPYIFLEKGHYQIIIDGKNFQNAIADIFSSEIYNNTQNNIPFTVTQNEYQIILEFDIKSSINDFEVRVYNNGTEDSEVILDRISIYKDNMLPF